MRVLNLLMRHVIVLLNPMLRLSRGLATLLFLFSLAALSSTLTLGDVQAKWLPDFIPGGSGGEPGFPTNEPPFDTGDAHEPNEVLILELSPTQHLVRLSIFGFETFYEFTVGRRGRTQIKMISFDKEYRHQLETSSRRVLQSKVAALGDVEARALRTSLSDGGAREDVTWFDPYFIMRFYPGARFYALVEKKKLTIDPERFQYRGSYETVQSPLNRSEAASSRIYWPASALGAGSVAMLDWWRVDWSQDSSIPGAGFSLAVLLRPIPQAFYDVFFLGVAARRNPKFRPLRGENLLNGSLVTGTTAGVVIAGARICEYFLQ
jgi:hypothetical protein